MAEHFDIIKIAEATYGEVYRLAMKKVLGGWSRAQESVLKIMALKVPGTRLPRHLGDNMSGVNSVKSEVETLIRMTPIPGFTYFRDVRVMEGRLPAPFITAWKEYNEEVGHSKSSFPDPSSSGTYRPSQLWAVIEMQNAGEDLENFQVVNPVQVWDIFWGVCLSLARGEATAKFEHRDLHLGNICVQHPDEDENDSRLGAISEQEHLPRSGISGLKTTIIDYTLARAEMTDDVEGVARIPSQRVAFSDLNKDPDLFEGYGSGQYDVYRQMRSMLYFGDPFQTFQKSQVTKNPDTNWECYRPITNVLWLYHLLATLQDRLMEYRRIGSNETSEKALKDNVNNSQRRLTELVSGSQAKEGMKIGVLQYKTDSPLTARLEILRNLMEPRKMENMKVRSAGDVVTEAHKQGWLDDPNIKDDSGRERRLSVSDWSDA
ncbi:MAG: hypothetical protein M1817_004604 [Caeruleum heppii]|nr:MAG: hypothetical protein M1817_004604 [Caeruleum heppii]